MRRLVVVFVGAFVMLSASPAAAAAKPKVPTQTQLQAALLALQDMPTGYSAVTIADSSTGVCQGPTTTALLQQAGPTAVVSAYFAKSETIGPVVYERLLSYPTPAAAKTAIKTIKDTFTKCTAWDEVDSSGQASHNTLAAESTSKTGDQTLAFRYTSHPQSDLNAVSSSFDFLYIRKGNVFVQISQGGLSTDADLTQQFVGKAMKKLGRLGS